MSARRAKRPVPLAATYWNGRPTRAIRGSAVVADAPEFPQYWAREFVGIRIPVVAVDLNGVNFGGDVAYLDNREAEGWTKVTEGRGGPRFPHKDLSIEPESFRPAFPREVYAQGDWWQLQSEPDEVDAEEVAAS